MVRILAVATALAWALDCSTVYGATVTSSWTPYASGYGVEIRAAPGEANRITVTLAGDQMVVHDAAGLQPSPSCIADDQQTARCPLDEGLQVLVILGDGDDTFTMPRVNTMTVLGGEGNDVIRGDGNIFRGGETAHLYGGPGDDQLSGEWLEGGPGNDVLEGDIFDYSDHASGVNVDLRAGRATSAGELDRLVLTTGSNSAWVKGSPGPDVIRAAPGKRLTVESGAGDDVIVGGPADDGVLAGAGDDVVRGGGGFDQLSGEDGDDRLEGGSTRDVLSGGRGDDVLVGGAGHDELNGGSGSDQVLARDGEVDAIGCAGERMEHGDRATVDADDNVSACLEVKRAGSPRLELHALIKRGNADVLVVSCPCAARARACAGRIRFGRGATAVTTRDPRRPRRARATARDAA